MRVLSEALGLRDAVSWFSEASTWGNKSRVHEVPFEDWTLDGELLREMIRSLASEQIAAPGEEVTLLSDRWVGSTAVKAIARLLAGRPGHFDDGRIALYVCQVDGDFGCATFSADVVIGPDSVEWRNLGWQVNYEPGVAGLEPPLSIRFERTAYEAVLGKALVRWQARAESGP